MVSCSHGRKTNIYQHIRGCDNVNACESETACLDRCELRINSVTFICPGFKELQIIVRTEQTSSFAPHSPAREAPGVSEKVVEERETLDSLLHHHLLVLLRAKGQLPPSVSERPKTMGKHSDSPFSSTKLSALESCPQTIECPGEVTRALVTLATVVRT